MGATAGQVVVFANLLALDGRREELLDKFRPVIAANRTEQGCIAFDVHEALENPDLLLVHEIWETQADFDRHLGQAHVHAFLEDMVGSGFGEQQPLYPSRRVV
jgi:quinol monooxygenase YgiN